MSKNGFKTKAGIIVNHENTIILFRKELITKLLDDNCDVYVFLPDFCDKRVISDLGAKVVPYSLSQHGTNVFEEIKAIRSLSHAISRIDPDIIYSYTIKPNLYGGLLCKFKKIPYVATITGMGRGFEQNSFVNSILAFALGFCLNKAKKVVFQNKTTMDYFCPKYIKPEQSMLVNGSGVDLVANPFEEYPDNDKTELLFVGRITADKGIRELLRSVFEINKNGKNVDLTLVGPVEADCQELVSKASKMPYFKFEGAKEQSEIHDYIKKCDAVVIPSYHEGMCNALLEAAAAGRPVITTRIPGCMETFEEMKNGIGCEARNTTSLYKAISKFYSLNKEKKATMGKYSRSKMEKEFDRNKIIQKYIDLVETN